MSSEQPRSVRPFAIDVDKYYALLYGGRPTLQERLQMWLVNSDFHVVASFRFSQWARRLYKRSPLLGAIPALLAAVWRRWVSTIHHVYIDRRAQIGPGFMVMHRGGIFIGPVVIGANAVLHHNVTLGMRVAAKDMSVPELGNNVWIGPGATITGGVRIGDDVAISAGSVLSKDVPAHSVVAGNPARVIRKDYDSAELIDYVLPPGGSA